MADMWNDFRRSHLEDQEKIGQGNFTPFLPWEMEQITWDAGQTGFTRIFMPDGGRPFIRASHWPKGGHPHTCTLEHPMFDGKCSFCFYNDKAGREQEAKGEKKTSPFGYRNIERVLEAIDFRYWHIVPHPKKEGKTTIAQCTHTEPDPKVNRCQLCHSEDEEMKKRWFGGHKAWELNKTEWAQIFALNEKMSHTCIYLDDGVLCSKEVYPVQYICGNCGMHEFISDQDLLRKPAKDLDKIRNTRQVCPDCQHEDFPVEMAVCASGAHDPERATMFDKPIEITCAGEATIGKDKKTYTKTTLSFNTGSPFSRIEDDLASYGFSEEEIVKMCTPWDLNDRYKPERKKREDFNSDQEYVDAVLLAQAEAINKPNPYSANPTGPRARPFGGGGGGPQGGPGPQQGGGGLRSFRS